MKKRFPVEVTRGVNRPGISFNGKPLYSDGSPPEKRVRGLPHASDALYIVVSPLLFYGVDELLEIIPEGSSCIAVEHNHDIYNATLSFHKQSGVKNFRYIYVDEDSAATLLRSLTDSWFRRIIPVKLNRGYMIERAFYDDMLNKLENGLASFWKNRMTTIHMGRLWCRNIFLNTVEIYRAGFITDISTDKPVICLGAGESLEESLAFIKRRRGGFFVVAADTAVTSLLLGGIKPDLVVAVESQHANLYDFYEDESLNLPVAADMTSSPELLRKIRGPLYLFISEFDFSCIFRLLDNSGILPPLLPPLGSVGLTSIMISLMITDQPILFSGLDFSFTPDKYHASGSPSHIITQMSENRLHRSSFFAAAFRDGRTKTVDKAGRIVYTDIIMSSYSDTLSELIEHSGRLIDMGVYGLDNPAPKYSDALFDNMSAEISGKPDFEAAVNYKRIRELPDAFSGPAGRSASTAFLKQQLDRLNAAISAAVDFQNTRTDSMEGRGSRLPEDLEALLKSVDYCWIFFPDRKPLPSSDPSFIRRFLFSAAWMSSQISNALSIID
ncbi:MAG: DUF115 domain-containing protein [Spirochaetales bacterium]|uniref:DUF115 domain-containing protein n=1 Tax=Candidatus Thalassospirochaeta sargassi TaxID=3119039 RepID=A0AAJ1ID65_9SPIO|nr:DUF115 domain-containing protein [Spirochaetales bacterium]